MEENMMNTTAAEAAEVDMSQEKIELEVNGFVVRLQKNQELALEYYTGTDAVVTIPAEVEGHPITLINEYAFAKNTTITKVVLPDTVREIGNGAFGGCSNLEEVVLTETVEMIDSYAFTFCPKLQELRLPAKLQGIHRGTFEGCSGLHTIYLPGTLHFIGPGAFSGCTALTELRFADGLERVLSGAFADSELKAVYLPASVMHIGRSIFGASATELHAPTGSAAEQYAKENNIAFVAE